MRKSGDWGKAQGEPVMRSQPSCPHLQCSILQTRFPENVKALWLVLFMFRIKWALSLLLPGRGSKFAPRLHYLWVDTVNSLFTGTQRWQPIYTSIQSVQSTNIERLISDDGCCQVTHLSISMEAKSSVTKYKQSSIQKIQPASNCLNRKYIDRFNLKSTRGKSAANIMTW